MKIKVNFNGLLARLEKQTEREFSNRYIAESSGIRRKTIIDMRREDIQRVSLASLEKLADFFAIHGLFISASDLLTEA